MRLLNTSTLGLGVFSRDEIPPYAILSHTWGDEEITFEVHSSARDALEAMKGWRKLHQSCKLAASLGFDWMWIDTCCIDKASSAELSEAINSMYAWYEQSKLCLVYLSDVECNPEPDNALFRQQFASSRWFTRGWTLQELIAPSHVSFYSQDWAFIGTRQSLRSDIHTITGIPESVFDLSLPEAAARDRGLQDLSLAQKMSWAADRQTTRAEDIAYCVMGLFDINMPLLYGEGREKAFRRLQEEIIKSTDDESIYAWTVDAKKVAHKDQHFWGILASGPEAFGNHGGMVPTRSKYLTRQSSHTTTVTSRGVQVELALTPFPNDASGTIFLAFLDCNIIRGGTSRPSLTPAILLQKKSWNGETDFVRIRADVLPLSMMNRIVLPPEIESMAGDVWGSTSRLSESKNHSVFVPHRLTATRLPNGIIFTPEIRDMSAKPLTLKVLGETPTWQHFKDTADTTAVGSYEINFDLYPVPDVDQLKEPIMLGAVHIQFSQMAGWNTWVRGLVVGLEPLPENPFGTPPLYTTPWCAFENWDTIFSSSYERVLGKEPRVAEVRLNEKVRSYLDLERRYSRLFYKVKLEVDNPTQKEVPRAGYLRHHLYHR